MKKFFMALSLGLCAVSILASCTAETKQEAIFFHSAHCRMCIGIKQEFLPAIKEKYKDKLEWKEIETSASPENLGLLLAAAKKFHRTEGMVPAILVGDTFLVGKVEITKLLVPAIESALYHKPKPLALVAVNLLSFFQGMSFLTVIGAGLIDGINPCAFAVIVFFVSFLGVYGYRKREIVLVGSFYCLAVFLTYLLLGLGFFQFLYKYILVAKIIKLFYFFIGNFCFLLSLAAVYDYYKYKKTGAAEDMLLQLPKFLKKKINAVIGSGLREKKDRGMVSLAISSLVIGFLVSLLEAVCTSQVYIPTMVYILKTTPMKLQAIAYLILYNLMFILPLILIFVLSIVGVSSAKFTAFLKRHIGAIKILMVILFFALGVLILLYA